MQRILFSLLFLSLAAASYADPRQWANEGTPVRAVSIIEDYSSAVRQDGSTLLVWAQSKGSYPVVMGQLLSPDGDALWVEGGIYLAQGDRRAGFPIATAVGNEWVILWQDAEITASGRLERGWTGEASLRLIRIDDNGNPVWAGGRAGFELVPFTEWWDTKPYTLYESGDGVIVTWRPESDHWAQRITANGQLAWPEAVHLNSRLIHWLPDIASDQLGGIVFCWWDILAGDTMVFANRLLQDGTFAWNDSDGVVVHSSDNRYEYAGICADFLGGAFVVWRENIGLDEQPHAQYINAQGERVWNADGVVLADLVGYRYIKSIAPSFQGDILDGCLAVMYQEDSQQQTRLLAQKVSLDGTTSWGANGITICSGTSGVSYIDKAKVISDQSGGAICNYDNRYNTWPDSTELSVTRVAADGTLPWGQQCGIVVGTSQTYYYLVFSAPSLLNESLQVVWLDMSYSDTRAILSQRMDVATGAFDYDVPLVLAIGDPGGVGNMQAARLSNGSTVTAWQARASGVETMLFQVLDVFGTPIFDDVGMLLTVDDEGTPLPGSNCALCPDGSGGFFAAFRSYYGGRYLARAVHLNGQGQHISNPAGEIVADSAVWIEANELSCVPDGAGGCYITASMYDADYFLRTVTTRINGQCEVVWDEPVVFTDIGRDVYPVQVLPSESNSCIVVFAPSEFERIEVRAARLGGDGSVLWNVELDSAAHSYYYDSADACSDAANGAYVVWGTTNAAGTVYQTRLQRVTATGEQMWGDTGIIFSDSTYRARRYSCDADVVGNLTVAWEQYNGQDMDIRAQRVSRTGDVRWPESGLLLTGAPHDQYWADVITLSDNEVYVVWNDDRNVQDFYWASDIYGTHLNALGEIGDDSYWLENGSPVCNDYYDQRSQVAIADGAGGVMVAWLDQRTLFNFEYSIFAQRLYDPIFTGAEESPLLPTEYFLAQNYPNPFNPTTTIEFALPHSGQTTLVVYDITGREVARLLDRNLEAGPYRVSFDAQSVASGVYFYSLRSGGISETKKMVLIR